MKTSPLSVVRSSSNLRQHQRLSGHGPRTSRSEESISASSIGTSSGSGKGEGRKKKENDVMVAFSVEIPTTHGGTNGSNAWNRKQKRDAREATSATTMNNTGSPVASEPRGRSISNADALGTSRRASGPVMAEGGGSGRNNVTAVDAPDSLDAASRRHKRQRSADDLVDHRAGGRHAVASLNRNPRIDVVPPAAGPGVYRSNSTGEYQH
ncbi:hypothetical protein HKX48_000837, partial [Thoreauomyces humboldtii]